MAKQATGRVGHLSGNADLIAYLEQRRRARIRAAWYALAGVTILLLAVLAVTAILHATGVGTHKVGTVYINTHAATFQVRYKVVGGIPILP